MQMLVRNRVRDFSQWYVYFNADRAAAAEYGLTLAALWQVADDPNNVFFILNVEDIEQANAFIARPESQEIGDKSGVIDGEIHYLEPLVPEA